MLESRVREHFMDAHSQQPNTLCKQILAYSSPSHVVGFRPEHPFPRLL